MSRTRRATRGGRASTVLLCVGVALAPVAGLLVWFAHGGGALRAAAVLAIAGTVLIGLSVLLRPDPTDVRLELQDNLLAETDTMRADLRSAVTAASQRTSQSLHAELAALQEQVDTLHARLAETERRVASPAEPAHRRAGLAARVEPAGGAPAGARSHRYATDNRAADAETTGQHRRDLDNARTDAARDYATTGSLHRPTRRRRHRAED